MTRTPRPCALRRRTAALALAVSFAWLLHAGTALAGFGPIQLRSVGELEQFAEAGEAAISGDGRYLAFQGTLAGISGVYREDLSDGDLQLVAGGSTYERTGARDAYAPSISDDGRYVSFTTATQLVRAARTGSNVYVRDMDAGAPSSGECDEEEEKGENGRRCAYELASAVNGGEEGLAYSSQGSPNGAVASARVALSADGREVAFVVAAGSDLVGGNPSQTSTPPLQVVVRYLDSERTVLVSAERNPATGQITERPVGLAALEASKPEVAREGAVTPSGATRLPGAALSGDGSTVAWLGADIPEQAPTLVGERQQIENDDQLGASSGTAYDEPLWRRIADGPTAPTRRMVGGGDPLAPGCPAGASSEAAACQGPFPEIGADRWGELQSHYGWLGVTSAIDGTPQLSYDGRTAALIGDPSGTSNAFVVSMANGFDRVQAVRELTREVPVAGIAVPGLRSVQYVPGAGEIYDIAVSPDGSRVAFATQRQDFPLAPPNYTEAPPTQLGLAELYEVNLARNSLVRVTHGPDGAPSFAGAPPTNPTAAGASGPSYTGDGRTLAFADTASNLVAGDANGASDVFVVHDEEAPDLSGPVEIGSAAVSQEPVKAQWRLSVVPVANADGSLTLQISVPGAGVATAAARATVPVIAAVGASTHGRAGGAARVASAAGRRPTIPKRRARRVTRLTSRIVALSHLSSSLPGTLTLRLRVLPRYAGLLTTPAGIYADVQVRFAGPGGPSLSQTATVWLKRRSPRDSKRRGSHHVAGPKAIRRGHR